MSRLGTIIVIVLFITPYVSFGCVCSGFRTLEQSVASTTYIAAIKVLTVDTIHVKHNSDSNRVSCYAKYTAQLTDRIKGQYLSDTITVYTSISSCEYVFQLGLKYILFAEMDYFKESGKDFLDGRKALGVNYCAYTSRFGEGRVRSIRKALRPPGADKVVPVKLYR